MSGRAGQGRRFDVEEALDAALAVFWEHGYEGASLASLTEAMGINPPSLYKAFGSKEELFFSVVRRYNETHGAFLGTAIREERDGLAMLRRVLFEAAEHYPSRDYPGGCLVISAAVTVTEANRHVAERLATMRRENVLAMAQRPDVSEAMARFTGATLQGMSQQARDGATAEDLRHIAELATIALEAAAHAHRKVA
ncbi:MULTISPECIES: TetR/AcrR family transcriptional regulator [Cellulomonas]|jgi:AcrR family transcriptional regulator|uniref:TetR/AcrR family transcriptional regulator n=1 Tax=Cellulomonas TaxID=1707 RepID=UPI0006255E45|nr:MULTISPECIES: TetR/AcrR family transcriptional regulator [Cellulomonas]MBO9567530.1 TetR/AcrR family transcriptional regulator [Cellulomonas iranensis]TFH72875.1 TetR/AcrR family transcriptional regulator [Cellulomonas sp. HD19AZ1]UCN13638.1 TetR/AcrR family transcriptional regulator [Cellulomonas iranensis]